VGLAVAGAAAAATTAAAVIPEIVITAVHRVRRRLPTYPDLVTREYVIQAETTSAGLTTPG